LKTFTLRVALRTLPTWPQAVVLVITLITAP